MSSSATWSRLAESDSDALHSGSSSGSRPFQTGAVSECSREATQFRLPCSVLISPARARAPRHSKRRLARSGRVHDHGQSADLQHEQVRQYLSPINFVCIKAHV